MRAGNGEMIDTNRECKGPNEAKIMKDIMGDYPTNGCMKFNPRDIIQKFPQAMIPHEFPECFAIVPLSGLEKSVHQNRVDNIDRELCTCLTNGCEPPKDSGNPIPANPFSPSPNPPKPNPNPPNPQPPNSNPNPSNDSTGTTDKNYSDPATHPNILSFLFIIASFFVIPFSNLMLFRKICAKSMNLQHLYLIFLFSCQFVINKITFRIKRVFIHSTIWKKVRRVTFSGMKANRLIFLFMSFD